MLSGMTSRLRTLKKLFAAPVRLFPGFRAKSVTWSGVRPAAVSFSRSCSSSTQMIRFS